MPLYVGKYAMYAFLQNMRNMLRSHDRYKPVSLIHMAHVTLKFYLAKYMNTWGKRHIKTPQNFYTTKLGNKDAVKF